MSIIIGNTSGKTYLTLGQRPDEIIVSDHIVIIFAHVIEQHGRNIMIVERPVIIQVALEIVASVSAHS